MSVFGGTKRSREDENGMRGWESASARRAVSETEGNTELKEALEMKEFLVNRLERMVESYKHAPHDFPTFQQDQAYFRNQLAAVDQRIQSLA